MARRRATVLIWDGDDLHELQRLRQKVIEAVEADAGTTATLADTDAEDARLEHNEFLAAAKERATKVVLEPLAWEDWDDLEEAHPPREIDNPAYAAAVKKREAASDRDGGSTGDDEELGDLPPEKIPHPDDAGFYVNTKTLPKVLIPKSIIEPAGFAWRELSKPDMLRLFFAALALNRRDADPKGISAFSDSGPVQDTDET